MSRYIDADAIISFVDAGHLRNPLELAWSDNDVVDMIERRPTVDAVPVVRCADCKHNNACLTQAFVEDASRLPFDRNTFFCRIARFRFCGTA